MLLDLHHAYRVRRDALVSFWKDACIAMALFWVPIVGPFVSPLLFTFKAAKAAWHLYTGVEVPPQSFTQRVCSWVREMYAFAVMAIWFFRAQSPRPERVLPGRGPVVAIHGICGHPSNMHAICKAAGRAGHPTYSAPIGTIPWRSLDRYVDALERYMNGVLERHPNQRIHFVAHSMGGLVLRQLLTRRRDIAALTASIDTIASPHKGTPVAHVVPGPEAEALKTGSKHLDAIAAFHELAPEARVHTFAATADDVVYPKRTSHVPGSKRKNLEGFGHVSVVTSREVVREILEGFQADQARWADRAREPGVAPRGSELVQNSERAETTMPSESA